MFTTLFLKAEECLNKITFNLIKINIFIHHININKTTWINNSTKEVRWLTWMMTNHSTSSTEVCPPETWNTTKFSMMDRMIICRNNTIIIITVWVNLLFKVKTLKTKATTWSIEDTGSFLTQTQTTILMEETIQTIINNIIINSPPILIASHLSIINQGSSRSRHH